MDVLFNTRETCMIFPKPLEVWKETFLIDPNRILTIQICWHKFSR